MLKKKYTCSLYSMMKIIDSVMEKKNYQGHLNAILPSIIQNWCLCRFCLMYRKDFLVKDRFASKYRDCKLSLENCLNMLNYEKVYGDKRKWTEEFFQKQKMQDIEKMCSIRFRKECSVGLRITEDEIEEVCKEMYDHLVDIKEAILLSNSVCELTDLWFPTVSQDLKFL